jgi:hypothetical protein
LIAAEVKTEERSTLFIIFPRAVQKDVLPRSAALILSEEKAMPGSVHGHLSVLRHRPSKRLNLTKESSSRRPISSVSPCQIAAGCRPPEEHAGPPDICQINYSNECDFYYVVDRLTML